jgi:hypothetical protein
MFPKNVYKREATKSNNTGVYQANKEILVGSTSEHNREKFEDCPTPPLLHHNDTDIVDSGCTGNFLLINAPFRNKTKYDNPLILILPNGDTMDSTHTASLDIQELSEVASISHVFPSMANLSLLSVGQLCNEVYYVTFKIDDVTIFNHEGKAILKGHMDLGTGLWRINLRKDKPQIPIAAANNMYELRNTGALVNYLQNAMFIPTK